jgi:hypothetical protein
MNSLRILVKNKIAFLAFILSLLSIFNTTFALDTLAVDEIQTGSVAISEVKALRVITVSEVPDDAESIDIGQCKVTFSSDVDDNNDTDCADDNAKVYTGGKSKSEVSDILDTLSNITDTNHGAITTEPDTETTTKFTTTGIEISATNVEFIGTDNITTSVLITGVVPVVAVAQVIEFTPTASTAANTTYRAIINGNNYDYISVGADTVQTIVKGLQPIIDADPDVTCLEDDTKITCTENIPGTSFTYASSIISDTTSPVFSKFVISGGVGGYAKAGDSIKLSLNIEPVDT